jgi:hypothetical protein
METAVCDVGAVEPFRRLVEGPLNAEELPRIERFVRTIVLHDRTVLLPVTFDQGLVIPRLSFPDYDACGLVEDAAKSLFRSLTPGSLFGLETTVGTGLLVGLAMLKRASVLTSDPIIEEGLERSLHLPDGLFEHLDIVWRQYAQDTAKNGFGLSVPPVLGIVLTRCARRDAIPAILADLRNEWSDARGKVWDLLDALKTSKSLAEAIEIRDELKQASKLFTPEPTECDSRPVRVFWDVVAGSAVGAAISLVAGTNPLIGAATAALAQIGRGTPTLLHEFGPAIFRRGAFDLARRVRRATAQVEFGALARLLTDAEKESMDLA